MSVCMTDSLTSCHGLCIGAVSQGEEAAVDVFD